MITTCEKCGSMYNDEVCWTICPHNRLESGSDDSRGTNVGYCREHDLYFCKFHHNSAEEGAR